MIKIPYGISNFKTLVDNSCVYADRTSYIEHLENRNERYIIFSRPLRFGKSLFVSLLEHYYGFEHKSNFTTFFNSLYIGQHPTPLANQYLVLKFDFSIEHSNFDNALHSFLFKIKTGALEFIERYKGFFSEKNHVQIETCTFPAQVIQQIILLFRANNITKKIYLLIDGYDYFTEETPHFSFDESSEIVKQHNFIHRFYEAIKVGTHTGIIDRLFITGTFPIILNTLMNGFDIAANITLNEEVNAMMGFTEAEVVDILRGVELPESELEPTMKLVREWYNGYLFSENAEQRVYNSDMVLYFAKEYARTKRYPEILLDPNIASDYAKVRKIFKIKNKEKEHLVHLDNLLKRGYVEANLVREFELQKRFDNHDFVSLLFYSGIVTITDAKLFLTTFKMPNYVIKQLYYQYFYQIILEQTQLASRQVDISSIMTDFALNNKMQPLIEHTEAILSELSVRDKMNFDEKHVKTIFTSLFYAAGIYTIRNEFEVKKSPTDKGFVDILLVKRPPLEPNYQFVIEFKYLKKEKAKSAKTVKKRAVEQLRSYLQHDEELQQMEDLKAYVVLFVGNEGTFVEVEK